MAIISEDYVSFEVAKLLKYKGFNEPTIGTYNIESKNPILVERPIRAIHCEAIISAPTFQMAMKWLREIYQIDIQVFRHIRGKRITFYARIEQNTHLEHQDKCNLYQSYEQACEAAIKYCLENLI